MNAPQFLRRVVVVTVVALPMALASTVSIPAAAQQSPAADVKKHDTTPGGKYEPSLDVLRDQPVDQP